MNETEQVAIVFSTIGNAAQMLSVVQPGKMADAFERQIDRSFYTDPTLAQKVLMLSKDVDRKMRLLRAAQTFVDEFDKVGQEVLAEIEETKQ